MNPATVSHTTRLVLVDDSLGFQRAVAGYLAAQFLLELIGVAGSVVEALALADTLAPDVVLLDIHLPDGTGLNLIQPLLQKWPRSKVIMLTFDDYPRMRDAALAAGATAFVSKLNAAEQLLPAIEVALSNQNGGPANDRTA